MGKAAKPEHDRFEVFVISPVGTWDAGLPIAASRARAVGLLDLTYLRDARLAGEAVVRLRDLGGNSRGVVLHARDDQFNRSALEYLGRCDTVLLVPGHNGDAAAALLRARFCAQRVGLVACCEEEAETAWRLGFDFVAAKGHESGGRVREETAFVLLQRLRKWNKLPVVAWGGIGLHSAAACKVAGAAGVVLDWQLALTRESPLPERFKQRIAAMDGSETVAIAGPDGTFIRLFTRPGMSAREKLSQISDKLRAAGGPAGGHDCAGEWDAAIVDLLSEPSVDARLWPVGQDAALARSFSEGAPSVSRCIAKLLERVEEQVEGARSANILARGSALARSHGTDYPIVQGPMTRVSDVPEFIRAVADGGGLPFLALALMRQKEAKPVLEKTKALLGNKPWGVGILGFVEREIRAEQLAEIEAVRPPFAIIAGGRPDQAASMEAKGIATYLHVPSPNMLDTFVREGARRFIFEGRECGGHVGPRSSFVLWDTMVRVLLSADLSEAESAKVHVLFAGGVNDSLSGAMVAALAEPLAAKGMKVGVLVGTAYLFTHEIVQTGAIVPGFQKVAVDTDHTILIETGPGHAIRCADTEYIRRFESEKLRMKQDGKDHEAIRDELEQANIGRLRIAAKGITRSANPAPGQSPYVRVDEQGQLVEGIYMIGQVAALRHGSCSVRELHEDVCGGAAAHLERAQAVARIAVVERERTPPTLDIAIVGLSCLLPGANDVRTFWRNLLANKDCVTEIPPDRFDAMRWYDADRNARDKIYSRWGGFLNDVPFDPLKYGIPPAAMKSIEPMQLLTLELVDQALRDAGYADGRNWKPRTGVVFGVGGGVAELSAAYAFRAMLPQYIDTNDDKLLAGLPEWTEDSFAGILPNVVAGRVANRFDLGGPNYTVDAACASSLAAVYLACRELADGSADMMITGGCDTMQNPLAYMCFATAGALSPRGRSRAFDHTADGIVISEGLAAVVLKRREDAERDGDRIYAVIRAVAGGSDGRTKAIATPCSDGQLRTLKRAYAQAGFSPATVGLYEAHGTGTSVGDQAECLGIGGLLRAEGARARSVAIGSAKSIVGHTKCAAGVVGLMKAALALHHRTLPPTLHVEKPNPKCGFEDGALYVNSELRPWIRGEHPRRAGVSSFGFGGSNFHAVLEEYEGDAVPRILAAPDSVRPAELFAFAAGTRVDLLGKLRRMMNEASAYAKKPEALLADLAFTVHRRESMARGSCRAAIVCSSLGELTKQLSQLVDALGKNAGKPGTLPPGVYYCDEPVAPDTKVAFLFPGQGSQYPDMLRDLAVQFGEVAEVFARADSVLVGAGAERRLSSYIFPPPAFGEEDRAKALKDLTATDVAQPALGACGLAALRLLRAFGLSPSVTAGHSYGELIALCAAGAMDEETLPKLSRQRAAAILAVLQEGQGVDLGRMMAVRAPEPLVRELLAQCPDVWVANCNSPQQVVISGTSEGLSRAARTLEAQSIDVTPIPVACAFHSPIMTLAKDRFADALAQVRFGVPTIPVFSNVTAAPYEDGGGDIAATLANQLVSEVKFAEEIAAIYEAGVRVFVEAGPHHVLTKLTTETLGSRPHVAVAMQPRGVNGVTAWLNGLATLLVNGLPVDMERFYAGRELKVVDFSPGAAESQANLPRHLWLVNGGYARPADAPKRLPTPVKLAPPGPTAPRDVRGVIRPETAEASRGAEPAVRMPKPAPASAPDAAAALSRVDMDVYAEFQETMRKFLETQQAIVTAYFGGAAELESAGPVPTAVESTDSVGHRSIAAQPKPSGTVPARSEEPPPVPVAPRVSSAVPEVVANPEPMSAGRPVTDLRERLTQVVCERTGYPPEMLDFAANLESDLGIDSIKRVEIIGAFRRSVLPNMQEAPSWFMERMTAAKTLNEILAGVSELAGGAVDAARAHVEQAPVPKAAAHPTELRERLVQIVAERTGYPPEMLDFAANLESDLGIDSIKRVEIIGAFRRSVLPDMQEAPSWFMEQMTAAKTLSEILKGVERLVSGSAVEPPPARSSGPGPARAAASEKTARPFAERTPRCVAVAVEAPLDETARIAPPRGVVLTAESLGAARTVEAQLTAKGSRVSILPRDLLGTAEAVGAAIEAIRQQGPIDCMLHLLPLREAPRFPGISDADWKRFTDEEVRGGLFLLQALAPELAKSSAQHPFYWAAVTLGGGDFDSAGLNECAFPWRGGLAGLLKTAAREWPNTRIRAVDFDEPPNGALVDLLLRESAADGPVEVGYRDGRRLAIVPVRAELDEAAARPLDLDARSVIVWTGGARGITAEIAHEFADRTKATMILLGRSALLGDEAGDIAAAADATSLRKALIERAHGKGVRVAPKDVEIEVRRILASREIRATLDRLSRTGARAEYIACDVRNAKSLEKALADVMRQFGRIDGVVHGAGIIEDKLIPDKTADSFDRVLGTKVDPVLTLCRSLDLDRLKFFGIFSSVAGFFGNPGQGDYAAANEVLNRIARSLQSRMAGKVVAYNWGPWSGAGMVAPEVARQFESRGVGMVTVPGGRLAAWEELLHSGNDSPRVLVGPGPWVEEADRAARATPAVRVRTPLLAGQKVYRRPGGVLEAAVTLDPSRLAYLSDHRIDGKAVLALAVATELMAEVAAAAEPGLEPTTIANVRQLSGVIVEQAQRDILVRAERIAGTAGAAEYRVRITDPVHAGRMYYESMVRLERNVPSPPPAPEITRIAGRFPHDPPGAYEKWLFHGPAFQVIESLGGADNSGIDAVVRPSCVRTCAGVAGDGTWLMDPMVLDAAPQLAILWSRAMFDTTPLPNRVKAFHRYARFHQGPIDIVFRTTEPADGSTFKADVWFIHDGRVLGFMEGLEGAGSARLNRLAERTTR